jgi:hypothetical protein
VRRTDARFRHPWLRIQRLLRDMLGRRWDDEAWAKIKLEIKKTLAERSRIERGVVHAGWSTEGSGARNDGGVDAHRYCPVYDLESPSVSGFVGGGSGGVIAASRSATRC